MNKTNNNNDNNDKTSTINQKKLHYIISYFLFVSNTIRIAHWMTDLYSFHKETDELHSNLNSLIDKFVESFIGIYDGRYKFNVIQGNLQVYNHHEFKCFLDKFKNFLNKDIDEFISKNDSGLINIRDEMVSLVDKALYTLRLS